MRDAFRIAKQREIATEHPHFERLRAEFARQRSGIPKVDEHQPGNSAIPARERRGET